MEIFPHVLPWIQSILQTLSCLSGQKTYAPGLNNIGVLLTHMLCFRQLNLAFIERLTFGTFSAAKLSLFCKRQSDTLSTLLTQAVLLVLERFPGTSISLVIDDTDRARSKIVKVLGYVFKNICKVTGGYQNCQNIVFLCAITSFITIPIGFRFYVPDPMLKLWYKKRTKILRCKRCPKSGKRCKYCSTKLKRIGPKPPHNSQYKTRLELAQDLLSAFKKLQIKLSKINRIYNLKSILADAAYMSPALVRYVQENFSKVAFISQLRSTQLVKNKNNNFKSLEEYFSKVPRVSKSIAVRHSSKEIEYSSTRLFIKSHGERMHVVATRYRGEKKFRYIVCSDLTWRTEDIIKYYGLRWLVEVAIQEWKQYSGIGKGACLYGVEGASCVLNLSLLGVTLFLLNPVQLLLARKGQPLGTTGSLSQYMMMDYFCQAFQNMLDKDNPKAALEQLKKNLDEVMVIKPSKKHPSGKWYPEITPSASLQAKFGKEQAEKLGNF